MLDNKQMELNEISFGKVIMMVCVVVCHSCAMFTNTGWGGFNSRHESQLLSFVSSWLGTFHVQTFTFASGYLFYMVRYERGGYRTFFSDIKKRARRLLIPYCFAAIFWVIPAACIIYDYSIYTVFDYFVLAKQPAQLWFLIMLFMMFLMFYFIGDFMERQPLIVGVLISYIAFLTPLILRKLSWDIFQIGKVFQYAGYYYLGMMYRKGIFEWLKRLNILIPIGVYVISYCVYYYLTLQSRQVLHYICVLEKPFISILGIWCIMTICNKIVNQQFVGSLLYNTLSSCSMGIYLIHQQVIYIAMRIFDQMDIPSIGIALLNFVVSIVASCILTCLLNKVKFGRLLIGS